MCRNVIRHHKCQTCYYNRHARKATRCYLTAIRHPTVKQKGDLSTSVHEWVDPHPCRNPGVFLPCYSDMCHTPPPPVHPSPV